MEKHDKREQAAREIPRRMQLPVCQCIVKNPHTRGGSHQQQSVHDEPASFLSNGWLAQLCKFSINPDPSYRGVTDFIPARYQGPSKTTRRVRSSHGR